MTSENFDGEWVARIMRRFGYGAARGSTSRGGARALAQLRRDMAAGHSAAFTVDGPRGPARVAQPGAVWLAGATGHPILPFHIEASKFWTVNSWDSHQVPKPGSDVAIAIAEPLLVPDTDEETVQQKLRELQRTLEKLEAETRAMIGSNDVAGGLQPARRPALTPATTAPVMHASTLLSSICRAHAAARPSRTARARGGVRRGRA